ncbi:MAG: uracil-DNA glycosylase family protein [Bacteroidota bacterium]
MTTADKIIKFNKNLDLKAKLPGGIRVMNPFKEHEETARVSAAFYRKYYDDTRSRIMILGINPGRFGAGITGIPFTDTKRLEEYCGIEMKDFNSHEPSSTFIYEMIEAYGGVERFYRDVFIGAVCPLGFVKKKEKKEVNYNYYDDKELLSSTWDFIKKSISAQFDFNIRPDRCICLGNNKNYKYLDKINRELKLFEEIIPLEHPRYIAQYKSKDKDMFIEKYLKVLLG